MLYTDLLESENTSTCLQRHNMFLSDIQIHLVFDQLTCSTYVMDLVLSVTDFIAISFELCYALT